MPISYQTPHVILLVKSQYVAQITNWDVRSVKLSTNCIVLILKIASCVNFDFGLEFGLDFRLDFGLNQSQVKTSV